MDVTHFFSFLPSFQLQFKNQAAELELYAKNNIDNAFANLKGLSFSTTSLVKRSNKETKWPAGFINIPDVRENLGLAADVAKALTIAYTPLIRPENRDLWIEYTKENKNWLAEEQEGGLIDADPIIKDFIWEYSDYGWETRNETQLEEAQQCSNGVKIENREDTSDRRLRGRSTQRRVQDDPFADDDDFVSSYVPQNDFDPSAPLGDPISSVVVPNIVPSASKDLQDGTNSDAALPTSASGANTTTSSAVEEKNQVASEDPFADDIWVSVDSEEDPDDDEFVDVGGATQMESERDDEYFAPVWQLYPVPVVNASAPKETKIINYNLADRMVFNIAMGYMIENKVPIFLDIQDYSSWFLIDDHLDILTTMVSYPVFEDFSFVNKSAVTSDPSRIAGAPTILAVDENSENEMINNSTVVGFLTAIVRWENFFANNLGEKTMPMYVVVDTTCGDKFTLLITPDEVTMLGQNFCYEEKYEPMKENFEFAEKYNQKENLGLTYESEICLYTVTMYPSQEFEDSVRDLQPFWISLIVFLVFALTSVFFVLFDFLVTRRQNKLLNTALRQNAIVNSLFPKNVQRKLMEEADAVLEAAEKTKTDKKRNLNTFLNDDRRNTIRKIDPLDSKPIADLFPHTTIMFADISGFTAWSSAREPAAVFTLLETIYRAFDDIAKRRKVFKVEVVGDCYVAVCGLPDPRKDHYAVMCRFAQDCMAAMHVHTKELEIRLGPDTGDLALRVGLHSGPVVAGVLRGDKSRFQLFGDTMNTASRMESTGVSNRIQLSQATADLLILNGKEHWITKRQDKVRAKGKGDLTTYFLLSVKKKTSSTNSASTSKIEEVILVKAGNHTKGIKTVQKRNRVADWVVEMLGKLLKEMKAKRKLTGVRPDKRDIIEALERQCVSGVGPDNKTVIDEVTDCLALPGLGGKSEKSSSNKPSKPVPLDKEVMDELQHYVYSIASLYQKNPFHNFEHASHVSMSCIKLLNRIASHDDDHIDSTNHHTYGICSDPLTSFGIVFSALIHDVDHCGVPNAQLVKEHAAVAKIYNDKSVAEQNSIDIGWGLLMEPTYANLRRHIYTTATEYKSFRQILVNCIMATDICDKDLKRDRDKRWEEAFASHPHRSSKNLQKPNSKGKGTDGISMRQSYQKATVVIEHLIQLSDVSHTMQHWHMYRRWNERLFEESYKAYIEGRAEKDPTEGWYKGELGFYDFYIIPLAKKIKQCAVFGVSSDEYLSYAVANREEWEERGMEVVDDMVKKVKAMYHGADHDSNNSMLVRDGDSKKGSRNNLAQLDSGCDANSPSDRAKGGNESSDKAKEFIIEPENQLQKTLEVVLETPERPESLNNDSSKGEVRGGRKPLDLETGSSDIETDATSDSTQSK